MPQAEPSALPHARQEGEGRTCLIVNVHARSGEARWEAVRQALSREGVRVDEALALQEPSQLPQAVRAAVEGGARRLLVGGGDGTLSCAAQALAGTEVVLGVLPLGTGNDFARSLGLPLTVEEAARVVGEGHVRAVDVGLANGRPFLNAASVGLTVAVARRLTGRLKRWTGRMAYPVAAAQEALDFHPLQVTLTVDGARHRLEVVQLVVGNGRFHGAGNLIAPEAALDDGRLHVYAIRPPSAVGPGQPPSEPGPLRRLAALARVSVDLRRGTHGERPEVETFSGHEVRVETCRPRRVNVDGEMAGRTPMRFTVWPRALRVLVPPPQ